MGTFCQHTPHRTQLSGSLALCLVAALAAVSPGFSSTAGDEPPSASGLQTSHYAQQPTVEDRPPRPPTPQPSQALRREIEAGEALVKAYEELLVQELSIEPGSQPLLPADAPAWIGALPDTSGEVHYVYVGGLIAETSSEAATLLDEALAAAVGRYVEETVVGRSGAALALRQQLTPDFIWKNLIDDPQGYLARLNTSGIPMYQKWVTVSITPQQRDMISDWNRQAMQRKRLGPVGVGVLGVLACVGVLHLIFRGRQPQL